MGMFAPGTPDRSKSTGTGGDTRRKRAGRRHASRRRGIAAAPIFVLQPFEQRVFAGSMLSPAADVATTSVADEMFRRASLDMNGANSASVTSRVDPFAAGASGSLPGWVPANPPPRLVNEGRGVGGGHGQPPDGGAPGGRKPDDGPDPLFPRKEPGGGIGNGGEPRQFARDARRQHFGLGLPDGTPIDASSDALESIAADSSAAPAPARRGGSSSSSPGGSSQPGAKSHAPHLKPSKPKKHSNKPTTPGTKKETVTAEIAPPPAVMALASAEVNDVTLPAANDGAWTLGQLGGSAANQGSVTPADGDLVLVEGDSFRVEAKANLLVPTDPRDLVFTFEDLQFDSASSGKINDAFEAALVDDHGVSLVHTFAPNRDAFFNQTQGQSAAISDDVTVTDAGGGKTTVRVDISKLEPGTTVHFVARLVNDDVTSDPVTGAPLDVATRVRLDVSAATVEEPAVDPGIYEVPTTGPVYFSFNYRDFTDPDGVNETGMYQVDDDEGRVNGLLPTDAGYQQAVLESANRIVIFARGQQAGTLRQATFNAGTRLVPYMVFDATSADALRRGHVESGIRPVVPPVVYLGITSANSDKAIRFARTQLNNGAVQFTGEEEPDITVTGDARADYDDPVFTISQQAPATNGLAALYTSGAPVDNLFRIDSQVDFTWPDGTAPSWSMWATDFTATWTGKVVPQYSQTYTFYTNTDGKVRLYVNNVLVINQWTTHALTEHSGTIALTAGQQYDIKMEYQDDGGAGVAQLKWSSTSQAKQIIPNSRLLSNVTVLSATPAAPTNLVAVPGGAGEVNLSWTDPSDCATKFVVERKTGAGGTYATIATLTAGVTSYHDTGLTSGTAYYYRVHAESLAGASGNSNEYNATPSASAKTLKNQWNFNEGTGTSTADASGSGNTGTLTSGANWTTHGAGNNALNLDGTNDYVALAQDVAGTLGNTASVSAWFYTGGTGSDTAPPGLIGNRTGSTNEIAWGYLDANGYLAIQAGTGAILRSLLPVNNFAWHHVVLTRNGVSGRVEMYMDGAFQGSAISSTGAKTVAITSLGRIKTGSSTFKYWNGKIDDLRIYDHVLTGSEVGAMVTSAPGTTPGVPTSFTATTALPPEVTLTWNDASNDVFYTSIERSTDNVHFSEIGISRFTSFVDSGLLPGHTYYYRARAIGSTNSAYTSTQTVNTAQGTTLVSSEETWRYLDNGTNQGTAWQSSTFDDSAWKSGPSGLGYSSDLMKTEIGYGPDSNNRYITSYFRKTFSVDNPAAITGLKLRLMRDDGAVVYINGTEVFRSNMPAGTVTSTTLASSSASTANGQYAWWDATSISPSLLNAGGDNVLAVEVHQFAATSTDLLFNAQLFGTSAAAVAPATPAALTAAPAAAKQIDLTWRDRSSTETGFEVQRKVGTGGTFATIATVPAGTTFYQDKALSPGTTYVYQVRAIDATTSLNSAYSATATATTTNDSAVTFVTDLPWVSASNGQGPVEKDHTNGVYLAADGAPITMGTIVHRKGLGVRADSTIVYDVSAGNYTRFLADASYLDPNDDPSSPQFHTTVKFEVWGDGVKLAESGAMSFSTPVYHFDVDITGVDQLKLVVLHDGDDIVGDRAAWGSPRLMNVAPSTPTAPSNPTATGVNGSTVRVRWQDNSASEWGFKVERSDDGGANYTQVGIVPTGVTSYDDAGLVAGAEYFYRVRAYSASNNSAYTSAVSARTVTTLPAPWRAQDVGAVLVSGSSDYTADGTFTVRGAGDDIQNDHDQFQFVNQTLSSNGELVARVTAIGNTNASAKAGVMFRKDLTTGSPYAGMFVKQDGSCVFQFRQTSGGATLSVTRTDLGAGGWVKIARSGNTFSGYYSTNGTTWVSIGSDQVTMNTAAYVGLGVTSKVTSTLNTSTFANVKLDAHATIIQAQSSWKYLDNGSNQGTAWRASGFNDSAWASGNGILGYNVGNETTTVSFGPNSNNKYVTTYFRKSFNVADPNALQSIKVRMQLDDGAVVYLNGTEIWRPNMPTGTISYTTLATTAISGSNEYLIYELNLTPSQLATGTNVLAVEVHQQAVNSSDISFDLQLFSTQSEVFPGPVKFTVVDPGTDTGYRYNAAGAGINTSALAAANTASRGAVSNVAGDKLWVIDNNKSIYVYNGTGTSLGSWTGTDLQTPVGIATDNTDVWIVDSGFKNIRKYAGAATRTSGSITATSSFNLDAANANPSDVVTDGTNLWVTDDTADKVFVYSLSGTLLGSWSLDARNADASGITLTPGGSGTDLWMTDRVDKVVYHYANAVSRLSGQQEAADLFALAPNNQTPEGISDPPTIVSARPADGASATPGTPLLVSGQVTPGGAGPITSVTINGTPARAIDAAGNFFGVVPVASANKEVSIVATDATGSATRTVNVQGIAPAAAGSIDFNRLTDVTSTFGVSYGQTSFDDAGRTLYADMKVTKTGSYPVRAPLLVAVKNISDARVKLANADGVLPDGTPYYDLSSFVSDGVLSGTGLIGTRTLSFTDAAGVRFTYDLVFLAPLNAAPTFSTVPVVEVAAGRAYAYDADATDPDAADTLSYSLGSGPTGLSVNSSSGVLSWSSTSTVGNYPVHIRVADGHGGTDDQTFVVSVVDGVPNRPPVFTSTPVVDGYVAPATLLETKTVPTDGSTVSTTTTLQSGKWYMFKATGTFHIGSPGDGLADAEYGNFSNPPSSLIDLTDTGVDFGIGINDTTNDSDKAPFWGGYSPTHTYYAYVQGTGATATLKYHDNNYPDNTGSLTVQVYEVTAPLYSYQATATDADGDDVQFTLLNAPAGMTISRSGLLQWAPTADQVDQTFDVTIKAYDLSPGTTTLRGGEALQSYSVHIQPTLGNHPPVIVTRPVPSFTLVTGAGGSTKTLNATVRDFKFGAGGHPDFETFLGDYRNMVSTTLGADHKPVYIGTNGGATSATTFNQWYNDVSGVNQTTTLPLLLNETSSGSGIYTISSGAFFPIDGQLFGNQGNTHNYHFTLELHSDFTYRGGENFSFTGDDDIWVFINDHLVIDLGGVHAAENQSISLDTIAASIGLTIGQTYAFDFFFAERHTVASNFELTTGIKLEPDRQYVYDVDAIDPDNDVITYSLLPGSQGVPAGMAIDAQTGRITWNPTTAQAGVHHIIVQARDPRGGTDTQEYDLTVETPQTNRNPHFVTSAPTRVNVGETYTYTPAATDDDGDGLLYRLVSSNAPGLSFDLQTNTVTWVPQASDIGHTYSVQLQVTDSRGGGDTQTFSIEATAGANTAPTIISTPGTTVVAGKKYLYKVIVDDAEHDAITFSLPTHPDGMVIDPVTGVISWLPDEAQTNGYRVVVHADDGHGASAEQSFVVSVIPANRAPAITSVPPQGPLGVNQQYRYQVTAQDPNGDAVHFSLDNPPAGASIDSVTGLFTWTPAAAGSFRVNIVADDGRGGRATQSFTATVAAPVANNAPAQITSQPPAPAVVGRRYEYQVTATDADNDAVLFRLGPGAPAGMTIDRDSGLLAWTPGAAGDIPVTVVAVDVKGMGQSQSFVLPVVTADATNAAPVIDSVTTGSSSIVVNAPLEYHVLAHDPDGDAITFGFASGSQVPAGMTIDRLTGVLTWTPTATVTGQQVVIVATDSRGAVSNSLTLTFNVTTGTIPQEPPTITSTPPQPGVVGTQYSYQVAVNNPHADTITYAASAGMSINSSGLLTFTPSSAGPQQITITATNTHTGAQSSQTYILNVVAAAAPNHAPVITSSPQGPAVAGQQYRYQILATDLDGDGLKYSLDTAASDSGAQSSGLAVNLTSGLLTWTPPVGTTGDKHIVVKATDARGLTVSQSFDLRVIAASVAVPNDAPAITSVPAGPAIAGKTYLYQTTAIDPNGDTVTFALEDAVSGMSIDANSGLLTWNVPTPAPSAPQRIVVIARDSKNAETRQRFDLPVVAAATTAAPPQFTSVPTGPAVVGTPWTYLAQAFSPNGLAVTYSLDAPQTTQGVGFTINGATGLLTLSNPALQNSGFPYHVAVVATADGVSVAQIFDLPVIDLTPTHITTTPSLHAVEQTQYTYDVNADPSTGVTFRLDQAPAGMVINPSTGVVTWTPAANTHGTYGVTVVADGGDGGLDFQHYTLAVAASATNQAPQITANPRTTVTVGDTYQYQVRATDPDGDALTYSFGTPTGGQLPPPGLTIDSAGLLRWTPGAAQVGSYPIRVVVSDGHAGTAQLDFTITVASRPAAIDGAPQFTSSPSLSATADRVYTYQADALDPEGDPLTWTLRTAPAGMSVNAANGLVTWIPALAQVSSTPFTVVLRASDPEGAYAEQTFSITVRGVNVPPAITSAPPTTATVSTLYTYAVRATDADGDALTFALDATSIGRGMSIDARTGVISWTPSSTGTALPVTVTVSDGKAPATQTYAINVVAAATNHGPTITSAPPQYAAVGVTYTYKLIATDPDNNALTYSITQNPGGATITPVDTNSDGKADFANVTWTPTSGQTGLKNFTVKADDGSQFQTQFFQVFVATNSAPTISTISPRTIATDETLRLDIPGNDTDGDPLTYTLVTGPSGMTVDATTGRLTYKSSQAASAQTVTVRATDPYGAFANANFSLTVTQDTTAPVVQIVFDNNPVAVGSDARIRVYATDNVGVTSRTLTVGGRNVAVDADGWATVRVSALGAVAVSATATDAKGNVGNAPGASLLVVNTGDTQLPQASIASPAANDVITIPTVVTGTVKDPEGVIAYVLEAAPAGTENFQLVNRVNYPTPISSAVANAALGTFDPTLLANGTYTLRLTVTDTGGNTAVATRDVNVTADVKVGNFKFSEVDLTVPLSGIPITLTRSYDSLNKNRFQDFGYGWELGFDMHLTEGQQTRDLFAQDLNDPNYRPHQIVSVRSGPGMSDPAADEDPSRDVFMTLPDGRRTKFTFGYDTVAGDANSKKAVFTSEPGVHATLAVLGDNTIRRAGFDAQGAIAPFYWAAAGGPTYGDVFSAGGLAFSDLLAKYDIPGYVLTLEDGTKFILEKTERPETAAAGDDGFIYDTNGATDGIYSYIKHTYFNDPHLTKIIDAQGNQIDLTASGITHSDGTGIVFHRDTQGRISSVTDQTGATVLSYTYDASGDLTAVTRLIDGTTTPIKTATTNYIYKSVNGASTHIIDHIQSPEGKTPIINEYDDSGRLVSSTDAFGKKITYTHDLTGRTETVADRRGGQTVITYDANGDVLQSTNQAGETTRYTYDTNRNQTSETIAYGTPLAFTKNYAYDAKGFRTTESYTVANNTPQTTDDTITTSWDYMDVNGRHVLSHMTAPDGTSTDNTYNTLGLLTESDVKDSNGVLSAKTTFAYDARGNQTGMTRWNADSTGTLVPDVTTSTVFDDAGHITETHDSDAAGNMLNKTTFSHDTYGNTLSITPFIKNTSGVFVAYASMTNEYDRLNRLVKTTDPLGGVSRTVYDRDGQVFQTIDEHGVVTQNNYDALGQTIGTIIALGTSEQRTSGFGYDRDGHLISKTDELGKVTHNAYDAAGRAVQTSYPDGSVVETVYDAAGRISATSDRHVPGQQTHGTRTTYDQSGRVIRNERLDNVVINIATNVDVSSSTLFSTGSVYSTTSSTYDSFGRVLSSTDAAGRNTTNHYDAAGRLDSVTDALNHTTTYQYDAQGRQTRLTDANGHHTDSVYDELGRVVETIFHDGTFVTMTYDALDRKTSETDQLGHTTNYEYDVADALVAVVLPAITLHWNGTDYTVHPRYEYGYDALGQQTVQRDAMDNSLSYALSGFQNRETTFSYDGFGRLSGRTLPDTEQESWTYDSLGRQATHVDFKGQVEEFVYDNDSRIAVGERLGLGRVIEKRYYSSVSNFTSQTEDTSQRVHYTFDALGRVGTVVDGHGTVTNTYDLDGRLTSVDSPEGTINYVYDQATSRHIRTYTASNETDYGYDELGRLQHVYQTKVNGTSNATYNSYNATTQEPTFTGGTPPTTTYTYDALGNHDTVTLPNGVVSDYDYDALNRIDLETVTKGETTLASYDYVLLADGQRDYVIDTDPNGLVTKIDWTYDAINRLTGEKRDEHNDGQNDAGDYDATYSYDLVGNRLEKLTNKVGTSNDDTTDYTYNADDHLTQEVGTLAGTTTYQYDSNGSQTRKTRVLGGTTVEDAIYRYDLRNRLVGVNTDATGTEEITYGYDDAGDRVKQVVSGATTLFLTDLNNPTGYSQTLEEKSSVGSTPSRSYVIGNDVIAQAVASVVQYLLYDGQGSTRGLLDSAGNVLTGQIYAYDAFGNAVGFDPQQAQTRFLFSGEQFDTNLQQYYLRARNYAQASGRFSTRDSYAGDELDPAGLNLYAYAYNDPIDFSDPSGHVPRFLGTAVHSHLNRSFESYAAPGVSPPVRFPPPGTPVGPFRRWANRQIRTIRLATMGVVTPWWLVVLKKRPDFAEVNSMTSLGDVYELKRGLLINAVNITRFLADTLIANLDLWANILLLNRYVTAYRWGPGITWIPVLTPWPTFRSVWQPPGTTLVTYNWYSVEQGVIMYDFIPSPKVQQVVKAAAISITMAAALYGAGYLANLGAKAAGAYLGGLIGEALGIINMKAAMRDPS